MSDAHPGSVLARLAAVLAAIGLPLASHATPPIVVKDGLGRLVSLASPAARVVTLAPSFTEAAFSVGSGARVVGVSAWSDWPESARSLPVVASAAGIEWEGLARLAPDLVIAWEDGFRLADVARIEALGARVFVARGRSLGDIVPLLEAVALLTGGDAGPPVRAFRQSLEALQARRASLARLRVFLEVSHRPLLTAGRGHFLTEALSVCGADNVFGDRLEPAPSVSWEELFARNPEAIVGTGALVQGEALFWAAWRPRSALAAVQRGKLAYVASAALGRPSPRVVEGIESLCAAIDGLR